MAVLKYKKGLVKVFIAAAGLFLAGVQPALSIDKTDSLAALYNNLAVTHALNNDFDLAKVYLDSAGMLVDNSPSLDNNRGNYYLCTGQALEAIDFYRAAAAADPHNKNILFNLSIGLYLADSIDASVDIMQQFCDYASQNEKDDSVMAGILDEVMAVKGDSKKVSKAEIQRLIEKAKAKRNDALKKKENKSKNDSGEIAKEKDKPQPTETSQKKKPRKTSPAGEKSYEMTGITKLLYWVIL
jgi:tetratricopeptide (TPR) repeat protein